MSEPVASPSEAAALPVGGGITALQRAIAAGTLTRRTIVETHLERIAAVNGQVNGFVEVRGDEALAEAERADAQHGRRLNGALDGVPMSVKDSYAIAGLARTDGLRINAHRISEVDDSVVTRLRDAGALLLGHGNVPDLCVRWNTVSGCYGPTRNPRDPRWSVGGSSGGEAANVASGMAVAALGQDLGGSVRVPASFCGVYGIRTTPGVVGNRGTWPAFPPTPSVQAMGTIGPLARTIDDLEAVFRVISRYDVDDPSGVPGRALPADEPTGTSTGSRPRVAVLRHETGAVLDERIERRLDETIEVLRECGYPVDEGAVPPLARAPEVWAEINGTDLMQVTLPRQGERMLASGRHHVEDLFGAFDLGTDHGRYQDAWIERAALCELWARFSSEHPLVIAPVAGMPTPTLDYDEDIGRAATLELFDRMRCVPWVNLLGLPALSLPNGIQLVARPFHDAALFRVGREVARMLPAVEIAG